jgi:hypothetical protein
MLARALARALTWLGVLVLVAAVSAMLWGAARPRAAAPLGVLRRGGGGEDWATRLMGALGLAPVAQAAQDAGLHGLLVTVLLGLASFVYRRRVASVLDRLGLRSLAQALRPAASGSALVDEPEVDDLKGMPELADLAVAGDAEEERACARRRRRGGPLTSATGAAPSSVTPGTPGEDGSTAGAAATSTSATATVATATATRAPRRGRGPLELQESCLIPCELAPHFSPPPGWLAFDAHLGMVPYESKQAWDSAAAAAAAAAAANAAAGERSSEVRKLPPVRNSGAASPARAPAPVAASSSPPSQSAHARKRARKKAGA